MLITQYLIIQYIYLNKTQMGTAKSIANMYTYNEYLYYYINAKDTQKVQQILQKRPNLIKDPLTVATKVTALNQVAVKNNLQMANLLIDKYKADPNMPSVKGETPLIAAIRKNNIEMVKLLLSKGANPNYIDKVGFKTIQYAILQGLYEIAYILYPLLENRELRTADEYVQIGKKFGYRYVNYEEMLANLMKMEEPERVQDKFLIKKKIVYSDPVIDPRQTWKAWFLRNMDFRDPPLVQRASLPMELRPQNRTFGRIGHFFGKLTMGPASQQPSYKPANLTEEPTMKKTVFREEMNKEINSQNLQLNSVA